MQTVRPRRHTFYHDPDEKLDYSVDWSDAIPTGDDISTSTWTDESGELTLSAESKTTTATTVWITGGVVGESHKVRNEIVTEAGREMTVSLYIQCVDK